MKIYLDRSDTTGITLAQSGSGNVFSTTVVVTPSSGGAMRIPVIVSAESTANASGTTRRTMLKVTMKIPRFKLNPSLGSMEFDATGTEDLTLHTVLTSGRNFAMIRGQVGDNVSDVILRKLVGTLCSLMAADSSVHAIAIGDGTVPSTSFAPFTRAFDEAWPLDGSATYGSHA